jgi:NADH-quinone oxidoreductase subunit A
MDQDYASILTYCLLAAAVTAGLTAAVGRARRARSTPAKSLPYECGIVPERGVGPRLSVRFYVIAMLFVVLDVEAASFYPWAVRLRQLGAAGLADMAVFLVVLAVGYLYVWKKGALELR